MPVEAVIPYLCSIVEDIIRSLSDDLIERCRFKPGIRNQFVQLVHIAGVVFAVVVLECLGRDVRLEGIFRVGKLGEFVLCHGHLSC